MRRAAAVLSSLTAAAVTAAAPALAVAPAKGARFSGRTSQGFAVTARTTSNGKTPQLRFRDRLQCSNGDRISGTSVYARQAPTITADGRIDYFKRYPKLPPEPGFPRGTKQFQRITGRFVTRDRVSLRVAQTVVGLKGGPTCRFAVTFVLRRQG